MLKSRSINEVLRILDTREKEESHLKKKCSCEKEFIDMEAKNAFQKEKVITLKINTYVDLIIVA